MEEKDLFECIREVLTKEEALKLLQRQNTEDVMLTDLKDMLKGKKYDRFPCVDSFLETLSNLELLCNQADYHYITLGEEFYQGYHRAIGVLIDTFEQVLDRKYIIEEWESEYGEILYSNTCYTGEEAREIYEKDYKDAKYKRLLLSNYEGDNVVVLDTNF